ncbi:amidohydrolase [Alkalicoccobacillus plakortidis]|uniref:amidohydrolase n=1 Tax=Alkalicoccobacillus plakortidis TaxID=444060 RepID=UPI0027D986DA|nr:amidohydrolase [Alkalicoccobacillus plakortidis]
MAWCEYQTTAYIVEKLSPLSFKLFLGKDVSDSDARMGLPTQEEDQWHVDRARKNGVPHELLEKMKGNHTGLVAQLDTGKPGKHMAFRFDIDALPIHETQEVEHAPVKNQFASRHNGQMHACGHDGHTSIGLGVAHLLHDLKDELTGTYTLIFQPAEEGVRGAKSIVQKGWLDHADLFLAGHIMHQPEGTIVPGISSSLATSKYNVVFSGVSSHAGASPETGQNALFAAATAATQLYGIARHSGGATRINVGKLIAGNGRNIIADTAYMEIETRGETNELNEYVSSKAEKILKAAADMHDVQVSTELVGKGISAQSDDIWNEIVQSSVSDSTYVTHVSPAFEKIGGSEDATYMMERVQAKGGLATYLLYGSTLSAAHHNPAFDYGEGVLAIAVDSLIHIVLNQQI